MSTLLDTIKNYSSASAQSAGIELRADALRVEQGEYIIADLTQYIGTYNVQQCVVIYIRDQKGKHGLAHIDGHTEIESVQRFLNFFFPNTELAQCTQSEVMACEYNAVEVKVGGAHSKTVSGLNDAEFNLAKVHSLLRYNNIAYSAIKVPSDFIVDVEGVILPGFPLGNDYGCTALHAIQQLKRKDSYMGTYPIIEGCSANSMDSTVYLDERALLKLREYDRNDHAVNIPVTGMRLGQDIERYFYSMIGYISLRRNETISKLTECMEEQKGQSYLYVLENVPLVIPDTDCTQNMFLLNKIMSGGSWQTERLIMNQENSVGTLGRALEIAARYDQSLDRECMLSNIQQQYNIIPVRLELARYDADVGVKNFNEFLSGCRSSLYPLIVLNSAEQNSFEMFEITNNKAFSAAKLLGASPVMLLQCLIKQNNVDIQNKLDNLSVKQYYVKFTVAIADTHSSELTKLLSKRAYKTLKYQSQHCDLARVFRTVF